MKRHNNARDETPNEAGISPADTEVDAEDFDQAQGPDIGHLTKTRVTRRRFLATGAATGVAASAVTFSAVHGQESTPDPMHDHGNGTPQVVTEDDVTAVPEEATEGQELAGFTFFTPFQAAIVAAAADRLIPSDNNGPGALEARVVYFIDRQLRDDGHFRSFRGPRYGIGPFANGEPTQGDQSAFEMQNRWRLGIEGIEAYAQQLYEAGFAELEPDQQDRILRDMEEGVPETFDGAAIQNIEVSQAGAGQESSIQQAGRAGIGAEAFFQLLRSYTFAGFFADPVHGGNRDMVGWKLIGFPGAQGFVYHDWILRYGEEFTGGFQSLAAYQDQFTGGN